MTKSSSEGLAVKPDPSEYRNPIETNPDMTVPSRLTAASAEAVLRSVPTPNPAAKP